MKPQRQNACRLPLGGQIDRRTPLDFTFNGQALTGYQGDTLASALLANGIHVVARSFKYHRPRGIFTAGEEEPNALVEVGSGASRIPNCRAPTVALEQGLISNAQTGWPSLDFDLGRAIDFSHALWPAGFYNKTFKWPSWHHWEGLVRRMAGLGRPLQAADPDHYEQLNAHCDLLIAGAGPAGLVAALAACKAGLRVILADQAESAGGVLLWEQARLDADPAAQWLEQVKTSLRSMDNLVWLQATTVSGIYDHNVTTLLQRGGNTDWRECYWTVRPRHILLATGAIEQGLIFPGNDRPGIMLAGAVRQYLNRYAVAPGRNAVLATNNDTAYQTVFDLAHQQIAVSAVIDSRETIAPVIRQQLEDLGTEIITSARISETAGSRGVHSVGIEHLDGQRIGRRECDLVAVSGGWSPRAHLLAHARGSLRFDDQSQSFIPDRLPDGISAAGSANGTAGLQETLQEALRAASAICSSLGFKTPDISLPLVTEAPVESRAVAPMQLNLERPRQWIDLAHDVTLGDAQLAVREGFVPVEHFKRFTTTGMSLDQGKTGNLNAFIVLGALTGRDTGEVGTTTFRPPYMPVTLGAIAGRSTGEFYAPRRYLPAHGVHEELGGAFEDYDWQRPDYYPLEGEDAETAIGREVMTVRQAVGVFDNSPIGKLEVKGPDAAEFLNRLYINNVGNLRSGHIRYGLMLNENGVIIDDGVFARLDEEHFLVNTTSAGVARIAAWMEELLQCEWPQLDVLVDNVTCHWANFTLAGPNARELLQNLEASMALGAEEFPHMACAQGTVAGIQARVLRVSFSGETSYEINVAADHADAFLRQVISSGKALGISAYGIEALMVLRMEKGYLHVGSDTDGSSIPDDVGWGAVADRKESDFIGKRSLQREAMRDPERKQLVGLEPVTGDRPFAPGAHLLLGADREPPARTDGWVTSACNSPTLGRHIALAVVTAGRIRLGETVTVCDEDIRFNARIVSPMFYDPENKRLKA